MNGAKDDTENFLNEQLQQLIREAKQFPAADENPIIRAKRRIALNKLISAIRSSGKVSHLTNWISEPNYQDYYNEALQHTFIEVCNKIEQYNPQYPVMAWVNKIVQCRMSDVVKKDKKKGITMLPKNETISRVLSLDEMKKEMSSCLFVSDEEQLKEIIEADTGNYLKSESINGHSSITLQVILLMILDGKKWKEISQKTGIPIPTLSSFYVRRLHKVIAYIKKYL
ncbi:RNA polymerase subunit sigma-24 [Calothrix sp. HK-06]|nr:RNA polymerase subunit sigma-24 [Calothrix sp. HK-06]